MMSTKRERLAASMGSLGVLTGVGSDLSPAVAPPPAPSARTAGVDRADDVRFIPLDAIVADPTQPRREFDEAEVASLAASIERDGLIQAVEVRWDEGLGQYVLVCGERRLRAMRRLGRQKIKATVLKVGEGLGALPRLRRQLSENVHRSGLSPMEKARAVSRVRELMAEAGEGVTDGDVARELSLDKSEVSRLLSLLEAAPEVQAAVESGELSKSTAAEIAKVADVAVQAELASEAVQRGATRNAVRARIRSSGARLRGQGKGRRGSRATTSVPTSFEVDTGAVTRVVFEAAPGVELEDLAEACRQVLDQLSALRGQAAA